MERIKLAAAVSAAVCIASILLFLNSHGLATQWQPLGPSAWGGATDPAVVQNYRTLALVLLFFGLSLSAVTFTRWLATAPGRPSGSSQLGA